MGARSRLYGRSVKTTRILINGEEKEFLLQQDIGPFLRALGYACSNSEIKRLCSPSVNEGPPIALWHGPRPLRTPDDVVAWSEKALVTRCAHGRSGEKSSGARVFDVMTWEITIPRRDGCRTEHGAGSCGRDDSHQHVGNHCARTRNEPNRARPDSRARASIAR